MNAVRRMASLALAAVLGLGVMPARAEETPVQPALQARVKEIIEVDGYQFKDLNDNGELDAYEDWRLSPEERAENLLSLMTAEQKAAQMVHLTLVTKKDSWFSKNNVGFALVYEYIFEPEEDDEEEDEEESDEAQTTLSSARNAAMRTNEIQELSESSELGIPVIFSMDTEAGAAFVKDATFLPDEINQGAAGDAELVTRLNEVLKEELMAVGVRMALSPDADLITDPRWGRNQECYSEDVETVETMIAAAVKALQGENGLDENSVMATVKHFPGAVAQTDGVDGSPLTISEDSIDLHLAGFRAAIEAGVAAVMPYGYSTVPVLGGDAVENSADQSAAVMTDLLRGERCSVLQVLELGFGGRVTLSGFLGQCGILVPCAGGGLLRIGKQVGRIGRAEKGVTQSDFGKAHFLQSGDCGNTLFVHLGKTDDKSLNGSGRIGVPERFESVRGHTGDLRKILQRIISGFHGNLHLDHRLAESCTTGLCFQTDGGERCSEAQNLQLGKSDLRSGRRQRRAHVHDRGFRRGEIVTELDQCGAEVGKLRLRHTADVGELRDGGCCFVSRDVRGIAEVNHRPREIHDVFFGDAQLTGTLHDRCNIRGRRSDLRAHLLDGIG